MQTISVKKHPIIRIILCTATLCMGLLSLFLIYRYYAQKNEITKKHKEFAIKTTQRAAREISHCTNQLKKIVDTIAADLSNGKIHSQNINEFLIKEASPINGLGVAFLPYEHDPKIKLFAPYVINKDSKQQTMDLAKLVDYTASNYERFMIPITHGAGWLSPFIDDATNSLIFEYSAPFYNKDRTVIGVVFGSYTIDYMQRLVASLYPSSLGYGAIIKTDGTFISHPNSENIGKKKTLMDVARDAHNPKLAQEMEKGLAGKMVLVEQPTNWISGQKSWIIFEPIPGTDWYTLGTFILNELQEETKESKRENINIIMSLVAFFLLLLLVSFHVSNVTSFKLWFASTATSIGLLIIIIVIWYSTFTTPLNEPNKIIQKNFDMSSIIEQINNNESLIPDLKQYTAPQATSYCSQKNKPETNNVPYTLIPTGILINQLSLDLDTITLGGYVWQRIPINTTKKIDSGVLFTQAKQLSMKEAYRKKTDNWETIGWSFRATLQQYFNYFNYPIDLKRIRIKLVPNSFDNTTVLVPDFDGYKILNPSSLPGINPKVNLLSWNLDQSYFSYQKELNKTNYGIHSENTFLISNEPELKPIPQLFFNVIVSRQVLSSLILNLMPITIILILLFLILLMTPSMEFQFTFGSIASLFFTALIAYTSFKSSLPTQGIMFFDYIYFILQGTILFSALVGILYQKEPAYRIVTNSQLVLLQRLFWPVILGAIFLISMIFFY